MANNQVRFSGSISTQDKSMLAQALKTNNTEIMEMIPDFFDISEVRYDGGQTTGSRAVILMLRGLRAFKEDLEQRGTLTTKSAHPAYAVEQEQSVEIEVESELAAIDFDVDDDDFFMVNDD